MPRTVASIPARADRLTIKTLNDAKLRELYARHIHAIVFRIIGEAFARLPTLSTVTASGYSQRPDSATGHDQDDYLISVQCDRQQWAMINFDALATLDPIEALSRFACRRDMSKTFILKAIEPIVIA